MKCLEPCVDSLMGKETFMRTKRFESLQKMRARVWIQYIKSLKLYTIRVESDLLEANNY